MAFDPHAGPGGELRSLAIVPMSPAVRQHVKILKRVSAGSSNLPLLLDYENRGEQLILVSSWIPGPDLARYVEDIRRGQQLQPSATEAFKLVRGLAHGLGQLHRRATIVHGDLKPANLILGSGPARLVMIDFGSAWLTCRTQTRDEGDGVSSAYAAPELQCGQFSDARSDQFSASVILFELLTLKLPYDGLGGSAGRPEFAARMQHKLVPPSRLSPDRSSLPKRLWQAVDEVVLQGLALDPNERFTATRLWIDALDRIHAQLKPMPRLSPLNRRLTGVVDWITDKLRRD
jgi:serine/threonine protein kinase